MVDEIVTRIEKLKLHPTEAIVLSFDFNKINVNDFLDLLNIIEFKFPNNTVVAIPNHISLQSCSKDVLKDIISMIIEIIDGL